MSETNTTTAAAVTVNALIVSLTSATGLSAYSNTAPQFIRIDSEWMRVAPGYVSGTNVNVYMRGDRGGAAAAHNKLATVALGLVSDITSLQPGAVSPQPVPVPVWPVVTYSVSGAIAIPNVNTTVQLDKAGVAVMTLAAPGLDQDGLCLNIYGLTAQANTVTCPTALFLDGLTGGPHTIWTATTGYKGQGLMIQASQGSWLVLANNQGTFS